MALTMDKREEGLRELASMIAADFRRRTTGEITNSLNASGGNGSSHISEAEITGRMEPSDSRHDLVYTETVGIRNFIRNRKRQDDLAEISAMNSEGGEDVTNKRNLGDCKATLPGEDQAGDKGGDG